MIFQHPANDKRDIQDLAPWHPRHRVQVDAQLVGVVQVIGTHRMRIEIDTAEVDHPGQRCRIGDDGLPGGGPARIVQLGRGDPIRALFRHALLKHRLLRDALDEPLQDHGPVAYPAQRSLCDIEVVVDQVALGDARVGKNHFIRVRDGDIAPRDLQHKVCLG
ncbi:Uncharacterised protein [Mycobacteroides abscessus subsp. abscessus]|nr:Uncharacterised protein [Mycobacteroides abscessus subsp. abscessus]